MEFGISSHMNASFLALDAIVVNKFGISNATFSKALGMCLIPCKYLLPFGAFCPEYSLMLYWGRPSLWEIFGHFFPIIYPWNSYDILMTAVI